MQLTSPVIITPCLMPGVRIGNSFISIDPSDDSYYLDLDQDGKQFSHEGNDLHRGMGQDTQGALSALLSFMAACGESFGRCTRENGHLIDDDLDDNAKLFPWEVAEWCYLNSDELSILSIELEETEGLIIE